VKRRGGEGRGKGKEGKNLLDKIGGDEFLYFSRRISIVELLFPVVDYLMPFCYLIFYST
jgi:hypothetical protein